MHYSQVGALDQLLVYRASDSALRKRLRNRRNRIERWVEDIDSQSRRSSMTLVNDNDSDSEPSSVYDDDAEDDDAVDLSAFPQPHHVVQVQPSDGSEDFSQAPTAADNKHAGIIVPQTLPILRQSRSPSPSTTASSADSSTSSFRDLLLSCPDCSTRFPAMTRLFSHHEKHCKAETEECTFCITVDHFSGILGTTTPPKLPTSTSTPLCDTFRDLIFHHKAFHQTRNPLDPSIPSAETHYQDKRVTFNCNICPPTLPQTKSASNPQALTTDHIIMDSVAGFPFFEPRQDGKVYTDDGADDTATQIERSMRHFYHPGSLDSKAIPGLDASPALRAPSRCGAVSTRSPLSRFKRRLEGLRS